MTTQDLIDELNTVAKKNKEASVIVTINGKQYAVDVKSVWEIEDQPVIQIVTDNINLTNSYKNLTPFQEGYHLWKRYAQAMVDGNEELAHYLHKIVDSILQTWTGDDNEAWRMGIVYAQGDVSKAYRKKLKANGQQ